jgi:hypothetical protein
MRAPHTTTNARTIRRVFTFRVSLHVFALALVLTGCPRSEVVRAAPDASVVGDAVLDAGAVVTEARLDAWLSWQRALAQAPAFDGGDALRRRARAELAALADAGLTVSQVDAIEAVVAAVVAERSVAKLTGADAVAQFKGALAELSAEQKAKAEAALAELQAKGAQNSLAGVEAQYGVEAVRVVLTREAEVTKTWDALLEARGDKR